MLQKIQKSDEFNQFFNVNPNAPEQREITGTQINPNLWSGIFQGALPPQVPGIYGQNRFGPCIPQYQQMPQYSQFPQYQSFNKPYIGYRNGDERPKTSEKS